MEDWKYKKNYNDTAEFKELLLYNAREAFALHEMIFNNMNNPQDYRYLYVNKAFEEITGLKSEEIIGKRVLEVLPGTEQFWINFFGEVVTRKERRQTTNYSQELDKFFDVIAYPIENNDFAVLFNDITELMEKENKLKYALQRSKKADQLKNQFLNDINHRLRTPFNGMMGMLQLINRENMDEENREMFDAMEIAMKNCNNVLNQISKYIEVQGMDYEFGRHYICDLMTKEIDKYANTDIDIKLTMKDNCKDRVLIIEKNVLKVTFSEVLSNAVKHTCGQKVDVTVYCESNLAETIQELHIDVVDYGLGIEMEKQEYIFNEFYHHDFINIYREPDKICLSICKQMLQSIGGDILVESEVGVHTMFSILIPVFFPLKSDCMESSYDM